MFSLSSLSSPLELLVRAAIKELILFDQEYARNKGIIGCYAMLTVTKDTKTIYSRVSTKPPANDAKTPLPVDIRLSKTLLLNLPNSM